MSEGEEWEMHKGTYYCPFRDGECMGNCCGLWNAEVECCSMKALSEYFSMKEK